MYIDEAMSQLTPEWLQNTLEYLTHRTRFYGHRHSEESRKRMGKKGEDHPWWGKHHTKESNQKNREAQLHRSPELNAAHSAWMTGSNNPMWGKDFTPEHRATLSVSCSKNHADVSGEKNPFWGKKHTDETKQNMRKPRKSWDYSQTPEHKANIGAALTGKKKSPEHIANMRAAQTTPEARERMSRASTDRWSSPGYREHMSTINSGENNPRYGKHPWNYGKKDYKIKSSPRKSKNKKKKSV